MNSFNQKKTVYVDKTLRICAIQFWQSCWNVSKKVRDFAPKFHENKSLDFRKELSNCLYSSRQIKVSIKKMLWTYKIHFWQSVEVFLSKYDKILLKFWEIFVNIFLLKNFPQ